MCNYHVGLEKTLVCSAYLMDMVAIMLAAKRHLNEVSHPSSSPSYFLSFSRTHSTKVNLLSFLLRRFPHTVARLRTFMSHLNPDSDCCITVPSGFEYI